MKKSLLVASLIAFAIAACAKKEDAAATSPAPVAQPAAPTPTEPSATDNPGNGLKLDATQATAAPMSASPAPAEPK